MKKPTTETIVIAKVAESERRFNRRVKLSRPLLARPSNPKYAEEVQTTLNTSRDGDYFKTRLKHYYMGMSVSAILGTHRLIVVIPRLSGRSFELTSLRMAALELQFTYKCADG